MRRSIEQGMLEERITNLKRMHNVMTRMNDEEVYMAWINYMPDEPSDDDINFIAQNDEDYDEIVRIFVRLVWKYGHEGILKRSDAE